MKEFPALVPQEFSLEGRGYLEAAADIKLSSAGKFINITCSTFSVSPASPAHLSHSLCRLGGCDSSGGRSAAVESSRAASCRLRFEDAVAASSRHLSERRTYPQVCCIQTNESRGSAAQRTVGRRNREAAGEEEEEEELSQG